MNAGLCLDRFGVPYIPGSAVKGCARRAAIAALREWCETNTKPTGTDNVFTLACAPFANPQEMLVAIALVFGWGEQVWKTDRDRNGHFKFDFVYVVGDGHGQWRGIFVLTVSDVKPATQRSLPNFSPNDPQSYVWHYASVSGTTVRGARGPRWQSLGALPAGTTFNIHVTWLRELPNLKPLFDEALFAFLTLGTLSLRATRGLGAFHCNQAVELDKMITALERKSFTIKRRYNPDEFSDYSSALNDWASWLRYKLRKEHKAAIPSALGSSEPRQASAVHFRPIMVAKNRFTWLAFEPPASRVLGTISRRNSPLLANFDFSGPAPRPEARARRY